MLCIDVDNIFKEYLKGETRSISEFESSDVLKSVALKSQCHLTVNQYRACRAFCVENGTTENVFVSYIKVLKAEQEEDAGNVDYNTVDINTNETVAHHDANINSVIDIDDDFGCHSYEMANPNIEGNRVSLIDSVCKDVRDLYPELKKLCCEKYPGLDLSNQTLVVRVKLSFDGTSSTVKSDKEASRLEVPSWFRGTVCVMSVDIVMDDGEEMELFKEPSPNSGDTNDIILLWKADENNFATVALAMSIYDEECEVTKNSAFDILLKTEEGDLIDVNENEHVGRNLRQRLVIKVDKPKDEKLSRKCHNRAGAGSSFPCTYCSESRTGASAPPFNGQNPITLTNRLEKEAGIYITQNPSQKNQQNILETSLGQKGEPFTTAEPKEEPMDVLHLDINIVNPLFIIGSRILHFGSDQFPLYTYVKTSIQKSDIDQSESLYLKKLLKFCPTIPDLTQMPGNFCREFSSEENKHLILKPLPECLAKQKFADVMDLWRKLRRTHKKTNPSENYRKLKRNAIVISNHIQYFITFLNGHSVYPELGCKTNLCFY